LPRPVGQENGAGIGDGCNTARWRGVPSDTGKVIGTAWYGSRHWGFDLAEHGGTRVRQGPVASRSCVCDNKAEGGYRCRDRAGLASRKTH
jgi:hypothetical protein